MHLAVVNPKTITNLLVIIAIICIAASQDQMPTSSEELLNETLFRLNATHSFLHSVNDEIQKEQTQYNQELTYTLTEKLKVLDTIVKSAITSTAQLEIQRLHLEYKYNIGGKICPLFSTVKETLAFIGSTMRQNLELCFKQIEMEDFLKNSNVSSQQLHKLQNLLQYCDDNIECLQSLNNLATKLHAYIFNNSRYAVNEFIGELHKRHGRRNQCIVKVLGKANVQISIATQRYASCVNKLIVETSTRGIPKSVFRSTIARKPSTAIQNVITNRTTTGEIPNNDDQLNAVVIDLLKTFQHVESELKTHEIAYMRSQNHTTVNDIHLKMQNLGGDALFKATNLEIKVFELEVDRITINRSECPKIEQLYSDVKEIRTQAETIIQNKCFHHLQLGFVADILRHTLLLIDDLRKLEMYCNDSSACLGLLKKTLLSAKELLTEVPQNIRLQLTQHYKQTLQDLETCCNEQLMQTAQLIDENSQMYLYCVDTLINQAIVSEASSSNQKHGSN